MNQEENKRLKKEISERLEKTNNNFSIGIFNFKKYKMSFTYIQLKIPWKVKMMF